MVEALRTASIPKKKEREPMSVIGNSNESSLMALETRSEEEVVRMISST